MRDFHLPGRSPVYAENGMCATSHPLAAKVAIQILEAGGNAVDAAIAGAVLLGVAEPQMTGIGGDCFALVAKPGGEILALNGSGRAPAALDAEAIRGEGHTAMPLRHAHAVTVPGAVDAFCRLSADHGRAGLATALAPAIYYAEAGVPVADRVACDWARNADTLTGRAREFYLSGGAAPKPGVVFRAPQNAEVLRRIAMDGREGFYEGEVAEDMVSSLRAAGGTHTLDDFAAVEASYGAPLTGTYGEYELVEHPPNGQGAAAILLTHILSQFDLSSLDPVGADRAHIEAEATKLAYDARDRFLADADHVTRLDHMLSMDTAKALAVLIDPGRAIPDARAASGTVHKDTVYITVVDRDRMAVSLIYSIFHAFGSGIASDKFGILFQNRGAGFSLERGHANEAGPGKRPMHTIIPGMIRHKGRLAMPFGVMGGSYQPAGHARFLTNLADYGMTPQAAIDAPRSFAEQGVLNMERGYAEGVRQDLAALGHSINVPDKPLGGAQAILMREDGVLEGGSDARKDDAPWDSELPEEAMPITPARTLVDQAKARIETLPPEEARARADRGDALLVDIRDVRELDREGRIPGAIHAPRGMLEFWMDPESPYHREVFATDRQLILFCAAAMRSALAVATLRDMGMENVAEMDEGFAGWTARGYPVETRD